MKNSEMVSDQDGGSASKPPGFIALSQDCWNGSKSDLSAHSRNPGPESALELLPSSALSSAQVFTAYPEITMLDNRTFHLLFKPDILTCYEHEPHSEVTSTNFRFTDR